MRRRPIRLAERKGSSLNRADHDLPASGGAPVSAGRQPAGPVAAAGTEADSSSRAAARSTRRRTGAWSGWKSAAAFTAAGAALFCLFPAAVRHLCGQLGLGERPADGLGLAARQPAAARLAHGGCLAVHHGAPAVRTARELPGPAPGDGARRGGHDVHAGRLARGPPGPGRHVRARRPDQDADRGRNHGRTAAGRGRLHPDYGRRPYRDVGPAHGAMALAGPDRQVESELARGDDPPRLPGERTAQDNALPRAPREAVVGSGPGDTHPGLGAHR